MPEKYNNVIKKVCFRAGAKVTWCFKKAYIFSVTVDRGYRSQSWA